MVVPAAPPPEGIVLVVEDDDDVRGVTARILSEAGFRAFEAHDGAQALSLLERLGPRVVWLVMSDVVMPRMGGDELAEIIAQRWPEVQVLLFSAVGGPRRSFRGIFLQKPFPPEELIALVRRLLPPPKVSV